MKRASDYLEDSPPLAEPLPHNFCGIHIEEEDIKKILESEDITFDPKEFEPRPTTVVIDSKSLHADLTDALGLLGRVQDMMLMLPSKSMKELLTTADYGSLNELDNDICVFLEDFQSNKGED